MSAFRSMLAVEGASLIEQAIEEAATFEEVSLDVLLMDFEIRGDPMPPSLTNYSDPLSILMALEEEGVDVFHQQPLHLTY